MPTVELEHVGNFNGMKFQTFDKDELFMFNVQILDAHRQKEIT